MSRPEKPGTGAGWGASDKRNKTLRENGQPQVTAGSVNEPRLMSENGFIYNEKWTYRFRHDDRDGRLLKHIYWYRYDYIGFALVFRDGRVEKGAAQ